jgi:hypothetical protein
VSVYRFYIFEKNDHVAAPPTIYELPDDAAALKQAKKIIDDRPIEIWRYTSKVARLNPRPPRKFARDVSVAFAEESATALSGRSAGVVRS